jgi:hypothetical protein
MRPGAVVVLCCAVAFALGVFPRHRKHEGSGLQNAVSAFMLVMRLALLGNGIMQCVVA